MKLQVITSVEADQQIVDLGSWWRENRTAAPDLFKNNLERALEVLIETPMIGVPYERKGIPGLRRYQIRKTPYHIYYVPDPEESKLSVLAVWSGMRKYGPPLQALPTRG